MANHNLGSSLATLVLAAATLGPIAGANAAYLLTEVSRPGAASTALWDVNNVGLMVGCSMPGLAPTDLPAAIIYDGSTFTGLSGPAGAVASVATGISDGGVVVGSYFVDVDPGSEVVGGPAHGFIYVSGVCTMFDVAGATDTNLRGIPPDVVEEYFVGATVHAFIATPVPQIGHLGAVAGRPRGPHVGADAPAAGDCG